MKMSKTISILLALILAMSAVSCGNESDKNSDTSGGGLIDLTSDESGESTTDDKPDLPNVDYNGYEFKIYTQIYGYGIYNNEHIVVEEENAEILNDAIYSRNRNVEEAIGIKLVEIVGTEKGNQLIPRIVMAQDDEYDLIIDATDGNFTHYIGSEYLVDFNSLNYVNLDKPWWDQNYIEASTIKGKLPSAISSMMITHMDSALPMLFNKKLANDFNLPDLYQLVRDGNWTLSKLFEISKDVASDIDGNTTLDDSDRYTFLGLDGMARLASGVKIDYAIIDSSGVPQINIESQSVIDIITNLRNYAMQYSDDIYNPRTKPNNGGDGDSAVFRLFMNDQALFFVHGLGSVQKFRDMKSDFGVIPTPKYDETQENYFVKNEWSAKAMYIPTTVTDLDRTAIVLELMAYEGHTYLRPRYYEAMLKSKYLRDDESIEMLDKYIFPNLGFYVKTGSSTLEKAVMTLISGQQEVSSYIASIISKAEQEIQKYVELY
ncbi:MAG: extracellular solute-binding protein [Clostridiales bacterium]|nr:extracellular solute-binding protein [Clostridiales bacterium]